LATSRGSNKISTTPYKAEKTRRGGHQRLTDAHFPLEPISALELSAPTATSRQPTPSGMQIERTRSRARAAWLGLPSTRWGDENFNHYAGAVMAVTREKVQQLAQEL